MKTTSLENHPTLAFQVVMTNTEFSQLRDAIIDRFGNEDQLKEWQKGKLIKLSYGIATGFRPRKEEVIK